MLLRDTMHHKCLKGCALNVWASLHEFHHPGSVCLQAPTRALVLVDAGHRSRTLMYFHLAANAVLLVHLAFIIFALFGAALAFRWRWILYGHLPAAVWAFFVEATGRICPLTYLENWLRARAGEAGYANGFIEHYFLPVIYPAGLTHSIQIWLAVFVVAVNVSIYAWLIHILLTRRSTANRGA